MHEKTSVIMASVVAAVLALGVLGVAMPNAAFARLTTGSTSTCNGFCGNSGNGDGSGNGGAGGSHNSVPSEYNHGGV